MISIIIAVVVSAALAVVAVGQYVTYVGERDSRWIREGFWKGKYFNVARGDLDEIERVNIKTLREGISKDQGILDYLGGTKCRESTAYCYFSMLSVANVLVDAGHFDQGIGLIGAVRDKQSDMCLVSFESSLLRYKIVRLENMRRSDSRREAEAVIRKIKQEGGLVVDLRSQSCERALLQKPEFFHAYTALVSEVMEYVGGDTAMAGAYIRAVDINRER